MDRRALLLPAAVGLLMVAVVPTARARPAPTGMTPFAVAAPALLTTQPGPAHDWGGRCAQNQPTGRLVTLVDPADGTLQPQPDGPYALLTFQRPDRTAARALAGGSFSDVLVAVGTIVADGTFLSTTTSIFEDTDTLRVVLDPCALTNPDDLPGRTIRLSWNADLAYETWYLPDGEPAMQVAEPLRRETGEAVLMLGPDSRAPQLRVVSPASGTRVRAGDTVQIVLHAEEPDNLGVWQTGVNRIELLNPDGDREERIISRDGPRACGDKVREGEATFTYRVPRDAQPGRTLDFVADAYDWANNRLSRSLTLVVEEEVWEARGAQPTRRLCRPAAGVSSGRTRRWTGPSASRSARTTRSAARRWRASAIRWSPANSARRG
jgi:hypothetical protein